MGRCRNLLLSWKHCQEWDIKQPAWLWLRLLAYPLSPWIRIFTVWRNDGGSPRARTSRKQRRTSKGSSPRSTGTACTYRLFTTVASTALRVAVMVRCALSARPAIPTGQNPSRRSALKSCSGCPKRSLRYCVG